MTDYILEITLPAGNPAIEEAVRGLLFLSASTGDVLVEEDWYHVISAFFDSPEDRTALRDRVGVLEGITLRDVDQERSDWLELYEQSLTPLTIGTRFIVAPDQRLLADARDRIALVIPQERAFGTGSHETTALCMEMLEEVDLAGRFCVDIGTGSGLLAIAMLRLGAGRVVAFDNDPDTLGVVARNGSRNGIERGQLLQYVGGPEALHGLRFGVATMNIIPEVIISLLPDVERLLDKEAALIVSGILLNRRDDVLAAAEMQSLQLARELTRGEWWCAELKARKTVSS